jgi:alcohol dehydrogenase class IV
MDLAKAAAVVARYGGHPRDYMGENLVPGPIMPLIAVSTTAGTGSEVSPAAVLKDLDTGRKGAILDNLIRPAVALCDPELTLSCPPWLTAAAGLDALTHAIEAYINLDFHAKPPPPEGPTVFQGKGPLTDVLALRAIELIGRNLERAVHHGDDLEARTAVHLGSLLAGMAFSNAGVGVVHAMEYPVAELAHRPHGEGNALLLPYVMEFNVPARPQAFAEIARAMGEDVEGLSAEEAAPRAVEAVRRLERAVGVPMRLSEIGITADQVDYIAERTFSLKRLMLINPRPVTLDDLKEIVRRAL